MGEYLDELCGYFVAIGVPIEEFWHGDYTMLKHYERAHDYRVEEQNQQMWLQGLYIHNAVLVAIDRGVNGGKKSKYLEKPIDFFPKTEYQKRLEEIEQRNKLIKQLDRWAAGFNGNRNRQSANKDSGER